MEHHSDAIASAIVSNGSDIVTAELHEKHLDRRAKSQHSHSQDLHEAAARVRNVDPAHSTKNEDDWFGGEYRSHFIALAMDADVPVHVVTQFVYNIITTFPNGTVKFMPMLEFSAGERDIFLYFVNGKHFRSLVPSNPTNSVV